MIDDICRNFHGGNAESEEANVFATPRKERDRNAIVNYLKAVQLDGATCDHLEIALGMPHQTCSARCSELRKDGTIIKKPTLDGRGFVRLPTRSGSPACVYILARYADGQSMMF